MGAYNQDDVAANAWRHLRGADRHADLGETPDAAQRLSNALDEGAKWFIDQYGGQRPARWTHEGSFQLLAAHAAQIEASAEASEVLGSDYPHALGLDGVDLMKGVDMRVVAARKLMLPDKWAFVQDSCKLLRSRIKTLGKNRDAAIYVDLGLGRGPRDISPEQVRMALQWARRVFRKWHMPGE